MKYARYALYYTPTDGPFADFGTHWLGWDPVHGAPAGPAKMDGLPLPWDEIVAPARKYGFHGTLMPPFRLADRCSADQVRTRLAAFCAAQPAVGVDRLELAQLGRFLALVPAGDALLLNALAAETLSAFDTFRAPLTEAELARRRRARRLSPAQDALLLRWGYPFVMEQFRFHMTLTGKLPKAQAAQLRGRLAPVLDPLIPRPFAIDAISLMGEDAQGMFHLIERHALSGMANPR